MRAPKVAPQLLAGVLSLVLSDKKDLVPPDSAESRDDGLVVSEAAIAVELAKIADEGVDVVPHERPARVPCHRHRLPGGKVRIGGPGQADQSGPHLPDVGGEISAGLRLASLQLGDFTLDPG